MTHITKKVLKKVEEVKEITCDFCGKNQKHNPSNMHFFHGGYFSFQFGFGSDFDTIQYAGDICDKCFSKKVLPLFHVPELVKRSCF